MSRKGGSLTTISVVKITNELEKLRARTNAPGLPNQEDLEIRIDEICAQLFPSEELRVFSPGDGWVTRSQHFRRLFARRFHSPQDLVAYNAEIDGLLAQLAAVAAGAHVERLKKYNSERLGEKDSRNKQIAKELFRRRGQNKQSDSQLIEEIGKKHGLLSKSQMHEAARRGEELLARERQITTRRPKRRRRSKAALTSGQAMKRND